METQKSYESPKMTEIEMLHEGTILQGSTWRDNEDYDQQDDWSGGWGY
ncbi:MAG: hypothetical protein NC115_12610 [Bacteroidales bacterium]|nr:hypothetical protein [Bacteroidales bacterium]